MTIEEIFTKLAKHMVEGMMTHDSLTKGYDFLGLYGFSKCHKYHYLVETSGYQDLLHYYSTRYHKLIDVKEIPTPDIIPTTWYKYTSMEVDTNTKRNAVKSMMHKWVEWEQETKKLYQEMYKEACAIGEIATADCIKCYILDVDDELCQAEKKLMKLENSDYAISTIFAWQEPLHEEYKKKLKQLFK